MRAYDVIMKKRKGESLTKEEISFFITWFTEGKIPEYQMAAFLMAAFLKGMDKEETATLTRCMAQSGDMMDLSTIEGIKVDKHSTGGVGDKTSLIIGPIVAACGVPVAKMSGRGLGHTGGTVDKLEAFPGLKTELTEEEFFSIVKEIGISIIGQSGNIAPADKKIYALRDVTATVDQVSLIAASIMSKKLASGADAILLDVKTGSGAFMKTIEDAVELAQEMVSIGVQNGRSMAALITDMDIPLGRAIGNNLEIQEVIKVLSGKGPEDLKCVSIELATHMLMLANKGDEATCRNMVKDAISKGKALEKLRQMVQAQGGDASYVTNPEKFQKSELEYAVLAKEEGYIYHMDTEKIGTSSVILGAGRNTKEDIIDFSAGILLHYKTGDFVKKGEPIATFYAQNLGIIEQAESLFYSGIKISSESPKESKLIYALVQEDKVEYY